MTLQAITMNTKKKTQPYFLSEYGECLTYYDVVESHPMYEHMTIEEIKNCGDFEFLGDVPVLPDTVCPFRP